MSRVDAQGIKVCGGHTFSYHLWSGLITLIDPHGNLSCKFYLLGSLKNHLPIPWCPISLYSNLPSFAALFLLLMYATPFTSIYAADVCDSLH